MTQSIHKMRILGFFLITSLLLGLLSACGGGSEPTTSSASTVPRSPSSNVTEKELNAENIASLSPEQLEIIKKALVRDFEYTTSGFVSKTSGFESETSGFESETSKPQSMTSNQIKSGDALLAKAIAPAALWPFKWCTLNHKRKFAFKTDYDELKSLYTASGGTPKGMFYPQIDYIKSQTDYKSEDLAEFVNSLEGTTAEFNDTENTVKISVVRLFRKPYSCTVLRDSSLRERLLNGSTKQLMPWIAGATGVISGLFVRGSLTRAFAIRAGAGAPEIPFGTINGIGGCTGAVMAASVATIFTPGSVNDYFAAATSACVLAGAGGKYARQWYDYWKSATVTARAQAQEDVNAAETETAVVAGDIAEASGEGGAAAGSEGLELAVSDEVASSLVTFAEATFELIGLALIGL